MSMLKEFKAFAMTGNLIDMAVGVVMGAAFGKVTSSFIDGMFMPLVGKIFQTGDLSKMKYVLSEEVIEAGKIITPESAIAYGNFIGTLLNFIVVAFVMFTVIKAINKMKKAEVAAPAAPAPPPVQEVLLAEIRDLLKK
jgi:large conductance mechanosensitive channel